MEPQRQRLCARRREGDAHGGGLPSAVMTKKSRYLVLIKAEAEAVHGRFGAPGEHFDQVLDTHTPHQVHRLGFKERLSCGEQQRRVLGPGREHFSKYTNMVEG